MHFYDKHLSHIISYTYIPNENMNDIVAKHLNFIGKRAHTAKYFLDKRRPQELTSTNIC